MRLLLAAILAFAFAARAEELLAPYALGPTGFAGPQGVTQYPGYGTSGAKGIVLPIGVELGARLRWLSFALSLENTSSITAGDLGYLRAGWKLGPVFERGATLLAPFVGLYASHLQMDNYDHSTIQHAAAARVGIDFDHFLRPDFSVGGGAGIDLRFPGARGAADGWAGSIVARIGLHAPILRGQSELQPDSAQTISTIATLGGIAAGGILAATGSSEGGAPTAGITLAALSLIAAPSVGRALGGNGGSAALRTGLRLLVMSAGAGATYYLARAPNTGGPVAAVVSSTVIATIALGGQDIASTPDDLRSSRLH